MSRFHFIVAPALVAAAALSAGCASMDTQPNQYAARECKAVTADFTNPMGMTTVLQHLALIGGLLCLFAHSQMRWSYDSMRLERKAEIARRDADSRVHDAELRAARAEGRVAAAPDTVVTDVDGDGRPEVRKRRWF